MAPLTRRFPAQPWSTQQRPASASAAKTIRALFIALLRVCEVDVEDAPVIGCLLGQPERRDGVSRLPLVRERIDADRMPGFGPDWLMSGNRSG
jgi:hypothetical protein